VVSLAERRILGDQRSRKESTLGFVGSVNLVRHLNPSSAFLAPRGKSEMVPAVTAPLAQPVTLLLGKALGIVPHGFQRPPIHC
jgi:hypothetical protein